MRSLICTGKFAIASSRFIDLRDGARKSFGLEYYTLNFGSSGTEYSDFRISG